MSIRTRLDKLSSSTRRRTYAVKLYHEGGSYLLDVRTQEVIPDDQENTLVVKALSENLFGLL